MANLLSKEDSPYLQQHKDNPVHWMPWCDEAFNKAKAENKAIFISIGYSSCHWCHVMEHEVFEDEALAEKLNESFVCIKVDREERPDIDKFYQEVHLLLNRRAGGWPASIFATPQNKPFFAGTYIPPKTEGNVMGFGDLIDIIAQKVGENDETLFANAEEIQEYLKPNERPSEAVHLSESIIPTFIQQCEYNFDTDFGGFGTQPKFPQVSTLKALLDVSVVTDDKQARHMCLHTLDNMIRGGMYDLVESGFCRYCTEESWLIPHFEKMTYDNALLSELYLHAYKHTDNEDYLNIAKDTLTFMKEKMSEKALYYSASDADTQGVEGRYFVYDYEEVMRCFQDNGFDTAQAKAMCSYLHITPDGNFEGNSIVRLEQEKPADYDKAITLLADIRKKRDYPFIDKKINTAWNAMIIKSLFFLSQYDNSFLSSAEQSLEALLEKLYVHETLYHTCMIGSHPKIGAFLEDYAYLATALIQAYQRTLDKRHLLLAQKLCDKALKEFFEAGRWYFSKGEFVTQADMGDSSYPGSIGVMVDALISLGILIDDKYRKLAFMSLEYYSAKLVKKPVQYPYLFNQTMRYVKEDRVIKADKASLEQINDTFLKVSYPFVLHSLSDEKGILLCGIQSCYANLSVDSNLDEEVKKTL